MADDGTTEIDKLFVRQGALRPVDVFTENLSVLDGVRPATRDGENVIHRCVCWTELFTRQGTAEVLANQQIMNFLNGHGFAAPCFLEGPDLIESLRTSVPLFGQPGCEADQVDPTTISDAKSGPLPIAVELTLTRHLAQRR